MHITGTADCYLLLGLSGLYTGVPSVEYLHSSLCLPGTVFSRILFSDERAMYDAARKDSCRSSVAISSFLVFFRLFVVSKFLGKMLRGTVSLCNCVRNWAVCTRISL